MPDYSEVVLDHFFHSRNAGVLADPDVVGRAGDPSQGGPYMLIFLRFHGEVIADARFQTYGCGPAIAAGSLLTTKVVGSTWREASRWTGPAISEALGGLPDHKRHCATLAATALSDALGRVGAADAKRDKPSYPSSRVNVVENLQEDAARGS